MSTSVPFIDRQAAHDARVTEINNASDAAIADARRALANAQTQQAAALAKAKAEFDAANVAADAAVAADILPQLVRFAQAFPKDERGASVKLSAFWREADARMRTDVGASDLSEHLLALAFALACSQGTACAAASAGALDAGAGSPGLLDAAHALSRACLDGGGPVETRAACAAMELAVERFARGTRGAFGPAPERLNVIAGCASRARYLAAARRFDEEKAARELAGTPNVPNGGRIVT